MKKSKDYAWLLYLIIAFIVILASSCGSNEPKPEITITQADVSIEYPYQWDSIKYNRIISSIGGETTSINFDITVKFNEEFVEIINNEFPNEEPIIWIGGWKDKMTFEIGNNRGTATVNHKNGFMTIHYNGGMTEIYTH
jgi:hypothetical protein